MSCRQFRAERFYTLGETIIYKALNMLMQRGYIRRHIPAPEASPRYLLNLTVIQQALDDHASRVLEERTRQQEAQSDTPATTSMILAKDTDQDALEEANSAPGLHISTEGIGISTEGCSTSTEGIHTSIEGVPYIYGTSQSTPQSPTQNTTQMTTQKGNRDDSDDVFLSNERVTRTVTELARILRLPVTPELRRLVEEYSAIPDLSLLGEADAAREWLGNPRRNNQKQTMSLNFFRNWLKRELDALRKQTALREQAKTAATTQNVATPASPPPEQLAHLCTLI